MKINQNKIGKRSRKEVLIDLSNRLNELKISFAHPESDLDKGVDYIINKLLREFPELEAYLTKEGE